MVKSSEFYSSELESISLEFPYLKLRRNAKGYFTYGLVEIFDVTGVKWDEYNIRIEFPEDYPKSIPTLFEIGNRIPHKADYHINSDGSCCLAVPALEYIALRKGITLKNYMSELVIPFLANQTYREKSGKFANGEFAHGIDGIYQFYSEHFKTTDIGLILESLSLILQNKLPQRNTRCYCQKEPYKESSKKYKKCHMSMINELSPVTKKALKKDYEHLMAAVKRAIKQNQQS